MGVYIKGVEMPKACYECRMYEADSYYCAAAERDIDIPSSDEGRCSFCPLVPVPPHGDLIERDPLRASIRESIDECHKWADEMREAENEEMVIRAEQSLGTFVECGLRVKNAPTIIPAEETIKEATNADRIRAMTDEKLAEIYFCVGCPPGTDLNELCFDENGEELLCTPPRCRECWLKWLRQEATP